MAPFNQDRPLRKIAGKRVSVAGRNHGVSWTFGKKRFSYIYAGLEKGKITGLRKKGYTENTRIFRLQEIEISDVDKRHRKGPQRQKRKGKVTNPRGTDKTPHKISSSFFRRKWHGLKDVEERYRTAVP
jgi:hypothetical protein